MSYSIHVATKYRVEYSDGAGCGSRTEELNELLYSLCPGGYFGVSVSDSDFVELPKTEAEKAIERLKDPDGETDSLLAAAGLTAEEMSGMLSRWLCASDPENDFMVLQWF